MLPAYIDLNNDMTVARVSVSAQFAYIIIQAEMRHEKLFKYILQNLKKFKRKVLMIWRELNPSDSANLYCLSDKCLCGILLMKNTKCKVLGSKCANLNS